MSKKSKIRAALGSLLALTLVVTCMAVYRSGSKSTPNEKEFVKENEKDSVDQAIRTEEREETEEETEDVNTSNVEGKKKVSEEKTEENKENSTKESTEDSSKEAPLAEEKAETAKEEIKNTESTSAKAVPAPDVNFTESSLMEWPVNGQVLIDYNMENTVYFPTLNVYKLNPAVAVSSKVGTPVAAAANGKIISITENEETGTTVTVDMGNGYQAVYGQLKDVQFKADEYVLAGGVLGYVNEPTKYYTKEGANLYFALKKDGIPLDPMQYLP